MFYIKLDYFTSLNGQVLISSQLTHGYQCKDMFMYNRKTAKKQGVMCYLRKIISYELTYPCLSYFTVRPRLKLGP